MSTFPGRAIACALTVLVGACSTIVEGTDQTVTIATDPSGAACELTRHGQMIGAVNPTPGSLLVDKSSDNISVICTKEGYQNASGTLASEFEGMTFGNILFGGIIGVAVDASSGAMNEYPASVTIRLVEDETEAPAEAAKPEEVPVS